MFEDSSSLTMAAAASETKRRKCMADYHAMLERIDLSEFAQQLRHDMDERNIKYGDRIVCPFLRPSFVTREQISLMQDRVGKIAGALHILAEYVMHDVKLQDFLGLTDIERELISFDPKYSCLSATSRFDTFLNGGTCRFVEYNAESPAGIGYSDAMSNIFMRRPEFRDFVQEHRISTFDISKSLMESLMQCWKEYSGGSDRKPVIAIVDFIEGLPTRHEFFMLAEYFASCGCRTLVADQRELDYDGKRLSFQGTEIDMIYRRVLTNEFIEKIDEEQNMYKAVKDGNVCVANSFRSKIMHKKNIFALLTDERYHEFFTSEQIEAIRACVPWTRRFEECSTTDPDGKAADLLKFVRKNRSNLVIKPNDCYGGRGIFFGWEQNESEWDKSIEAALAGDYLVQVKIPVARELFPSWSEKKGLEWGEYLVDLDPYAFGGQMQGATARLSLSSLCNVTSGGGSIPCMVLD